MSLNHDYVISTLTQQKVSELHAQAADDRLARIAMAGRLPWWRRLLRASVPAPAVPANRDRRSRPQRHRPAAPSRHVARY